MLLLPGTALLPLRKAWSTPQTRLALNLAVPQSNFFLSEVIRKCGSSLWNILTVVLISLVCKTAGSIPLHYFP